MNQTPALLHKEYLQKLAEDKKNLVYHYEYDTPQHQFTSVQRQTYMKEIRQHYVAWRKSHQDQYDSLDREAQTLMKNALVLKQKKEKGQEYKEEESVLKKKLKDLNEKLNDLDVACRDHICQTYPELDKFSIDHGKIMETLTSHTTTDEHVQHLCYMVYLKIQEEAGKISAADAQAYVQDYLVRQFKTQQTLEQYKKSLEKEE